MLKLSVVVVCVVVIVTIVNGASLDRGVIRLIPDGRIVGGETTTIEEFPWQVSMTHISVHRCGGSIISGNRVLTAAHCTRGTISTMVGVRFGSSQRLSGGTHTLVERFIEHPEYNIPTDINNDIAVLIMATPFAFGPGVQQINLPGQGENINAGTFGLVSGWGATSEGGSASNQLQFVAVPKIEQIDCIAAYAGVNPVTDNMICFGFLNEGGRDACQGDSGGPLVIGNTLQGIVSWGVGCARPEFPGVYTRVSYFINWVASV